MPFPYHQTHVCNLSPFVHPPEFDWIAGIWLLFRFGSRGALRKGNYVYSSVTNHKARDGFELHITNDRTGTLLGKIVDSQLYQML